MKKNKQNERNMTLYLLKDNKFILFLVFVKFAIITILFTWTGSCVAIKSRGNSIQSTAAGDDPFLVYLGIIYEEEKAVSVVFKNLKRSFFIWFGTD